MYISNGLRHYVVDPPPAPCVGTSVPVRGAVQCNAIVPEVGTRGSGMGNGERARPSTERGTAYVSCYTGDRIAFSVSLAHRNGIIPRRRLFSRPSRNSASFSSAVTADLRSARFVNLATIFDIIGLHDRDGFSVTCTSVYVIEQRCI